MAKGSSTSLVHEESSARLAEEGHELAVEVHELRQLARSSRAAPRSSFWPDQRAGLADERQRGPSVGAEERTPGSASTAKARREGRAEFSDASAGEPMRRVSRSAGIEASSATSSAGERAGDDVEVGDQVLQRLLVLDQCGERLLLALQNSRWMSLVGSLPRVASLTIGRAPERPLAVAKDWLKPPAPSPSSPFEYSLRKTWRSYARVGLQRGEHVAELHRRGGLVHRDRLAPALRAPAEGEPGVMSTKKLPSRKTRGRIFSSASSWIGQPPLLDLHLHARRAVALPGRSPRPS